VATAKSSADIAAGDLGKIPVACITASAAVEATAVTTKPPATAPVLASQGFTRTLLS
jgi:hypothetical protein